MVTILKLEFCLMKLCVRCTNHCSEDGLSANVRRRRAIRPVTLSRGQRVRIRVDASRMHSMWNEAVTRVPGAARAGGAGARWRRQCAPSAPRPSGLWRRAVCRLLHSSRSLCETWESWSRDRSELSSRDPSARNRIRDRTESPFVLAGPVGPLIDYFRCTKGRLGGCVKFVGRVEYLMRPRGLGPARRVEGRVPGPVIVYPRTRKQYRSGLAPALHT